MLWRLHHKRAMASRSKGTTKGLNGRTLSADKTYAANAQEQFQKVAKDTANLDVLARCKKLNEFLASVSLFCVRCVGHVLFLPAVR